MLPISMDSEKRNYRLVYQKVDIRYGHRIVKMEISVTQSTASYHRAATCLYLELLTEHMQSYPFIKKHLPWHQTLW